MLKALASLPISSFVSITTFLLKSPWPISSAVFERSTSGLVIVPENIAKRWPGLFGQPKAVFK